MRKGFLSLLTVAGVVAVVAAGAAIAETVHLGNLTLTADGSFKPTKLPKKEFAPIQLKTSGSISTDDGSTPPVADVVTVDFDKNGTVTTKGITTCDPRKLENTTTSQANKKCKDALVGTGETKAIVDFPDQEPFDAIGPLLIFNGKPAHGNPVIVFHVLANVPLPTTFVVAAEISKSPKKGFGKRVITKVPPIAGGNGTLVSFEAKINKTPATGDQYLLAKCANGRFLADVEVTWRGDVDPINIQLVRTCKAK